MKTKQEEIRDWLVMCLALNRGTIHGKAPDDKHVAQSILEGLHSQGVVIKVGEEPDDNQYYGDEPYHMYEDGWRKFEPLIEGSK